MTAMDRPDNGHDERESRELIARCNNYREDVDQPCTGRLRFRWGQIEAACDTCGGYCGVAVADWLGVTSGRAGAGEQQRDVVTDFLHQRFPQSRQNAQRHADELLALLGGPQPDGEGRQHRMDPDCCCGPVQAPNGAWDHQ